MHGHNCAHMDLLFHRLTSMLLSGNCWALEIFHGTWDIMLWQISSQA